MKKILLIVMIMLLAFPFTNIFAEEENILVITDVTTNEDPMPKLSSRNAQSSLETRFYPTRQVWLEKTININESSYKQKVIDVIEDENFISLLFENDDTIYEFKELTKENLEYTEQKVYKIDYIKPESTLYGSGYSSKIVQYYGWLNGYITIGSSSGVVQSIMNLTISYTPITSKLVSWVLGESIGASFSTIDKVKRVTAETKNTYYYLNKSCQLYVNGSWIPMLLIGSRRTLAWSWSSIPDEYGAPIIHQNGPKIPNNSQNPTNYDSIEKKNNFDNNTWILNKSIECYENGSGSYSDIYGLASNILN